jgi:multidrug efflux pump subunit AcrA (membrane-fusion protein)
MNKSMNIRQVLMLLGLLLIGVTIAAIIYLTAPKPQRNTEVKQARLVDTIPLKRSSEGPQWLGGGEISAAQRVQLSAQVAGRIEKVAAKAVPGAELEKGQLLASIEKTDYQLQVQQQKAAVIQAQASLDLEKGQALLAKEEYQLAVLQMNARRAAVSPVSSTSASTTTSVVEPAIDNSLVLREPQIAAAEAGLKTAQANLALMELYLERTQIKMPFKGQIISRSANTGSQVSTSSTLFDLVATDEFWLQVKVPQNFLPLLDITQPVIIQQGKYRRDAKILHSLIEVDARDRQAKILISIKNPLQNKTDNGELFLLDHLLLGSYVDCILFAKPIEDVYVVENRYIKEDGYVWVVNDQKLYKRELTIAYQGRNKSWVESGFIDGDLLLTSNLGVVTEGTSVRLTSARKVK